MTADPGDPSLVWLSPLPDGRVRVAVRRVYSAVLEHAGLPFIASAVVPTARGERPTRAELRLEGERVSWTIEPADPTEVGRPQAGRCEATVRASGSLRSVLDRVGGTRRVRVELSAGGPTAAAEVLLVEPWRWAWLPETTPLLACLVLPNDGIVRQVAAGARRAGSARKSSPDADADAPAALFEHLREDFRIDYAAPSIERAPGAMPGHDAFALPLQALRPPHRVIVDLATGRGEAGCLDLTLLLCGCLEATAHAPLIVLFPDAHGFPEHALLGFWRDRAQRFRPVLEGDSLRQACLSREIGFLETTRVCRDRAASVEDARAEATASVTEAGRVVAIDVRALRPPFGAVAPFEVAYDAAVLAAVDGSERIPGPAGTAVVETLHLFLGLVEADGLVGARLFEESGASRAALVDACHAALERRPSAERRGRTRGYERCLADARENARSQGSTVVRESDLWWAVLTSPSKSLSAAFDRDPAARARLLVALARIAPPARPSSTVA